MGKKGGSKHLKRLYAPSFWPIHRKEFKWSTKPKPGPHKNDSSFTLLLVLRELLGIAKTRREAHQILSKGHVKVDGVIRRETNFPVGLMDVIEIPEMVKAYRLLPTPKKRLTLHDINVEEQDFKICKIINKVNIKGADIQLNLHDGRNIVIRIADPKQPKEDVYKTRDVLKIKIPQSEILDHLTFQEGISALIENGKNMGRWGEIVNIEHRIASHPSIVTLKDLEGNEFKTIVDYVFPVGTDAPWISLHERVEEWITSKS